MIKAGDTVWTVEGEWIQNSIVQLLDSYVGSNYILDKVDRAISEQVKAVIRDKLQDFDVTITRRLTDV